MGQNQLIWFDFESKATFLFEKRAFCPFSHHWELYLYAQSNYWQLVANHPEVTNFEYMHHQDWHPCIYCSLFDYLLLKIIASYQQHQQHFFSINIPLTANVDANLDVDDVLIRCYMFRLLLMLVLPAFVQFFSRASFQMCLQVACQGKHRLTLAALFDFSPEWTFECFLKVDAS